MMKAIRYALFAILLAVAPSTFARDSYGFSISIGSPGYYVSPPPVVYHAPPTVVYHAVPSFYYHHYSPPPRAYYAPRVHYYQDRHGYHKHHGHGKHVRDWR